MNSVTGNRRTSANTLMYILLRIVASSFNRRPSLKKYLKLHDGWLELSVGIRTETNTVRRGIVFSNGRATVTGDVPEKTDVILVVRSDKALRRLLSATPTDQIYMMLKSDLRLEGSIMYLNLFFFLVSLMLSGKQIKQMEQERRKTRKGLLKQSPHKREDLSNELASRQKKRMNAPDIDPGVRYLEDPYLPEYAIEDFPRLKKFLNIHLTGKPEVCPELPLLLTRWHREHGFETTSKGKPWAPVLRKAHAYKYRMENQQAGK